MFRTELSTLAQASQSDEIWNNTRRIDGTHSIRGGWLASLIYLSQNDNEREVHGLREERAREPLETEKNDPIDA